MNRVHASPRNGSDCAGAMPLHNVTVDMKISRISESSGELYEVQCYSPCRILIKSMKVIPANGDIGFMLSDKQASHPNVRNLHLHMKRSAGSKIFDGSSSVE